MIHHYPFAEEIPLAGNTGSPEGQALVRGSSSPAAAQGPDRGCSPGASRAEMAPPHQGMQPRNKTDPQHCLASSCHRTEGKKNTHVLHNQQSGNKKPKELAAAGLQSSTPHLQRASPAQSSAHSALLPKPALVLHKLPWWKKSQRCATDSASQHLGAPVSHSSPPSHSVFPHVTQFFPEVLSAHEPFTTRCFAGSMRAT